MLKIKPTAVRNDLTLVPAKLLTTYTSPSQTTEITPKIRQLHANRRRRAVWGLGSVANCAIPFLAIHFSVSHVRMADLLLRASPSPRNLLECRRKDERFCRKTMGSSLRLTSHFFHRKLYQTGTACYIGIYFWGFSCTDFLHLKLGLLGEVTSFPKKWKIPESSLPNFVTV